MMAQKRERERKRRCTRERHRERDADGSIEKPIESQAQMENKLERERLKEYQQKCNDRAGKEQISLDKKHEREKGKDRQRGNRERDNQTGRQIDRPETLKGREREKADIEEE